ncbi:MAG: deaminase, partial [Proteobacteria bacterium]|nr:deaminase [Pseudomonadota bacterium]
MNQLRSLSSLFSLLQADSSKDQGTGRLLNQTLLCGLSNLITYSHQDTSPVSHAAQETRQQEQLRVFQNIAQQYFPPGSDPYYMTIAILAGHQQVKSVRPNPAVGCVYVKDQQIIGWGHTEPDGGDHGEVSAAFDHRRNTFKDISGATAYVILEPCCHRGPQSCTEFLTNRHVQRVVISAEDPDIRVSGGGIKALRAAGIRVDVGLLNKVT